MKRLLSVLSVVAVVVGLASGCVRNLRPPPTSTIQVAGGPLIWRDWSTQGRAGICDAEPRFLIDEFTQVNSGLQRFLNRSASTEAVDWPESRITAIEEDMKELPQVLPPYGKNLELLASCHFSQGAGFPFVLQRGNELIAEVKERTGQIDAVVKKARAVRAFEAWKRTVSEQRESLKGACPGRTRTPQLYFAWRDEHGLTRWKFCDGSEVTLKPGAAMVWDGSLRQIPRGQKKFREHEYLAAAKAWPEASVMSPPPVP